MPDLAVILPAAGSSTRYGTNKLLEPLGNRTVLARSVIGMLEHPSAKEIFIATGDEQVIASLRAIPHAAAAHAHVIPGGATRAQSVLAALNHVPDRYEWVAVHDAARPLVSLDLIDRTLAAAIEHGAAVPALPVHLTIKQASAPLPSRVVRTVPRQELWAMQTPQIMRRVDLLEAFQRCPIPLAQVTDDVQLLELIGKEVWLVEGDERNLKITTPIDLRIAQMILDDVT